MAYASSETGFVRLADAYCTGSSLLPQKRNPDVFELSRSKAARILGDLTAMLATLRGLPAGYSKDLQEDKVWLFDAVDTVLLTLPAVRGAVETLQPRADRMRAALDPGLLATDIADGLVRAGVPFREAHGLVGRLVRDAERDGVDLPAVSADRATAIHPALPQVLAALGTWEDSVERRGTDGGSARGPVAHQLESLARAFAAPWGTAGAGFE
jgi:argininosuccinate lyase